MITLTVKATDGARQMRLVTHIAALAALSAMTATDAASQQRVALSDGDPLIVELVDISPTEFEFRPATITAYPGAIIRFVQTGVMPHNVEFRGGPKGFDLGTRRVGPFLLQPGAVYEVVIDDQFVPGDYPIVCTPHEFMGMKGTITVVPAEASRADHADEGTNQGGSK